MIEKASATPVVRPRPRWLTSALLALAAALVVIIAKAGSPFLFQGATVRSELARQVRETTGLVLEASGQGRFDLLPRPRIVLKDLHFADPSGALTIDAASLDGDVRLLPLLVGRIELGAATLSAPRMVIDLDGRPMKADSTIGRAIHAPGMPVPGSGRRLGVVTLVDGRATLKSRALGWTPVFDAVDVTVDWPDIDSPATLSGSLQLRDTAADVSIWLAEPSSLMRGETSPLALRIQSTPLDLSANGDLSSVAAPSFRGHVALRAPSLPALVALAGEHIAPPAPFANVALNSDVVLGADRDGQPSMDLPSLRLKLDGNDYEGTLAYQGGPKASLSGTLATDQLSLAPFLDRAPRLVGADHRWSDTPIVARSGDPLGLDLRISATHMRAAPFTIDDAALSIMTREERTEVALVEGKAYGGDIKGRLSVSMTGNEVGLRGAGSLTDADAATMSWDGFGRQIATGVLSGALSLESTGDSPAALMRHLQGWAKAGASDGELSGIDLGRALRAIADGRLDAAVPLLHTGRTTFDQMALSLRLTDGIATVEDGSLKGKDATVALGGISDVGTRGLDLHLDARSPATTAGAEARPLQIDLRGVYDKVVIGLDHKPASGLHGPR